MIERDRLDAQITAAREGRLSPLTDGQAPERAKDIIQLADELAGDFCRVRGRFEDLNRDLRERLVDEEGENRGEVLHALFEGVDVIGDSDAGRTFTAFWRLLTDPEQSETLEESLEQVLARAFASQLETRGRRFLRLLVRMLLDQGGSVHGRRVGGAVGNRFSGSQGQPLFHTHGFAILNRARAYLSY